MSILNNRSVINISAHIASILFILVIIIQLLLAAGIFPVTMVWGGKHTVLTPGLRIASIISAIILGAFIFVIRKRAGVWGSKKSTMTIKIISWFITAYMGLNTILNLMSQSTAEKVIFTPITAILFIVCFIVSASKTQKN